jgi:hypothetical protein
MTGGLVTCGRRYAALFRAFTETAGLTYKFLGLSNLPDHICAENSGVLRLFLRLFTPEGTTVLVTLNIVSALSQAKSPERFRM